MRATSGDAIGRSPSGNRAVDALIVGAGYAGSIVARELARAGKRVLVLESGPDWQSRDLVSSQIWSRRLRGGSGLYRSQGRDPVGIGFNLGRGMGGAGIHHYAGWFRMHAADFDVHTRYGWQLDWPLAYDDLRPYYDRAQRDVGMSGDARAEVWRPPGAPYPLPPLPLQAHGRILKRGFDALGLRTSPAPQAILSRPYKGRPACDLNGWCDSGCSIGALGNPLVTFIPEAKQAGAVFRTGIHVLRVLSRRGRASGVEYVDDRGRRHVQEAKVVVLAAFALETPRLLLNSAEGGLANSSGLVGRFIHVHALLSLYGLFAERTDIGRGPTGAQLLCQEDHDSDPAKGGYFGGYQWLIGTSKKPNDLAGIAMSRADLDGARLDAFMRRASGHLASMDLIGTGTVSADNRLTLLDERDEHGMPIAMVTHDHDDNARVLQDAALAQGLEIMHAAGATEAWAGARATAHIMGGTIMGNHPRTSVVTSHGQTHDLENLFIATPGVFPTGSSVNPTFTQVAWTLRSAEYMTRHWRDFA
ncbi:MAG TPA: GMC family oxidoreductase [Yinghuangia sp.]|nr:GMC family oxidoreductase [Yinghuangia sp.]